MLTLHMAVILNASAPRCRVFESYLIGVVTSYYDTDVVFIAVGLTIGVFLGLTAFAYQTYVVVFIFQTYTTSKSRMTILDWCGFAERLTLQP